MDDYHLPDIFNGPGAYPSFDELVELTGVNEFTGPERRIKLGFPLEPEFHEWFDEVTLAAQKQALLLELDANAHGAAMGWCHLVIGGPRWPDLPSICLSSPTDLLRKAAEAKAARSSSDPA